ncbi:monovalent cation/H+ antiporter subunit D [Luteimonas sp. RD2P54]|uniref:Monovalent cation/H+ antiporter subunit D n=1 Tax=Luteimonas endophytica TaxID=3042023 RepID=A0ABT6J8U7_9GAMM|nr:monovalent cation/H+ antiporter subunit D [Luteimonas endophytica]MDH5823027.1 monovalent cation/H+ antiporter subunit D [Luteimonas endophytica]
MAHLPVLPVLLPLVAGALMLLVGRRAGPQRTLAWVAMAALLAVAALLAREAGRGEILVYLLGDWPARLGIALTVDRTSALMVLTTALLAAPCLLYACSGWDRRAPHFHALFQLQLAGLNGAFLTGDLFNLFVFFEVLLIASYGLMLSGGRGPRMRAGLHYVAFNITASTLFLIALGLLYGLTGTLNMAEMSLRVAAADPADVALIQAASGILLVVFCAKAALLPLYLWLPETYSHAPAAVAALFTVMTKVGVYAVLRVYTLVFGSEAGALAGWAWDWLLAAGIATLLLASLGALASPTLRAQVAWLVIASAATLFVAFSLQTPGAVAAGLYYLVQSTFVTAALFLIADMVRRQRGKAGDRLDIAAPLGHKTALGLLFLVAGVAVAGLPPLPGFVGKFALLAAVPEGRVALVWTTVLVTSLLALVAMARSGSQLVWRAETFAEGAAAPRPPRAAQRIATGVLLGYLVVLMLASAPVLRYADGAAAQLLAPADAVQAIRGTVPVKRAPSP